MRFNFDKNNTFCISLPSSKERQQRMQQRFQQFNMEVTIWPASTPDTLTDSFHGAMSSNEKACAQSHINIWKHMLMNELEYVFILEDDACFDKEWKEKLAKFTETVHDDDWDVIMLNASESMQILDTWMPAKEQYLAAGYILTNKGAQRLIMTFGENYASSDWMLTRLQERGHSYCHYPWLIIQEGVNSTIREDCSHDRNKVIRLLNEIHYGLENYV